jgi:hypothetical protein
LAAHEWPGLCAVSIECDWGAYARADAQNDQLKVHFWICYDQLITAAISDNLDAYLMSVVIDECCDYGRTGYASFECHTLDRPTEISLRGDPVYVRPDITWRAA